MKHTMCVAGNGCFKPYDVNLKHYHPLDGWHKELKCKTSSPDDYAVLAANADGDVVSVGRGVASKIIRCNNRGKWVASLDGSPKTEIEISDAFCFVIPSNDMNEGEQAPPGYGEFTDYGQM
ncbi:hypothetical protein GCK32_015536 [Trichostrongylus colubriformis]|uniref:Uncharacterized protein n=1 Tax=Trichostrongylus colubriformis TaxID=6319 RepID=A0AAN8J3G9_TRICO